ncbi:HNH endonuclease signature motif containing protein [Microbacterium soli]|uniref:HNH nuclease domain-containing protein n=1 Tax=Microbacterium soli TaxID=446075 RepID=A0ABP7NIW2_9MICO
MSTKSCAVDGCRLAYRSGGFCWKHLAEAHANGSVVRDLRFSENRPELEPVACGVEGCESPAKYRKKRLCNAHYLRIWNHGDTALPAPLTLAERLDEGIASRDGCWLWGGPISTAGYGRIGSEYAHRISHEVYIGPIPDGYQVDHLCFVRRCVNPAHLEAVTQAENLRRERLRMSRRTDGTWEKAS